MLEVLNVSDHRVVRTDPELRDSSLLVAFSAIKTVINPDGHFGAEERG